MSSKCKTGKGKKTGSKGKRHADSSERHDEKKHYDEKKHIQHSSGRHYEIFPITAAPTERSSIDLKYDYPFKSISIYPDLI